MVFVEEFIDSSEVDLSFELSKRKSLNLKIIKKKVIDNNLVPIIVDISINGYSSKPDFDFEVENQKWSDVKDLFKKGLEAQKDPDALTVKRAIRVCAQATTDYIYQNGIISHLNAYAPEGLEKSFMHLGGVFVVTEDQKDLLIDMWKKFDNEKNTSVSDSVIRILGYRFQ